MLNHFRKINPSLVTLLSARFGSHGAPVKIDIDKNATWIRYRAVFFLIYLESKAGLRIGNLRCSYSSSRTYKR